jgi:hypothetical protein
MRRLSEQQVRVAPLLHAFERFSSESPKRLLDVEGMKDELAEKLETLAGMARCRLRVSADAKRIGCYRVGMAGATWVDVTPEGITKLVETMRDWMARDAREQRGAE